MRHDDPAWLREQVRLGRLDPGRLALAAALGHEPSIEVMAEAPPPFHPDGFAERLRAACLDCGQEALQRLAITSARVAVEVARGLEGPLPGLDQALEAAQRWEACPCREHLAAIVPAWRAVRERGITTTATTACLAVREALRWCTAPLGDPTDWQTPRERHRLRPRSLEESLRRSREASARLLAPLRVGDEETLPLEPSCVAACTNAMRLTCAALEASGLMPDAARERLRQALCDAVAPWALGLAALKR
ncbi:MAG: hypothetical protein KIT58_23095 [Planctomycetota bacterium]|nr:hypothetical protein [Planctomycetota bacterium]